MQYHASHLMRAYARQPVSFVRGSGARLWDAQGFEYLDAIAGIAVTSLGHAHPEIAAAISEQAGLLLHTSNVFRIDWQERLGERLCALTGMQKAFFCNSGAEANEAALKLARLHGHRKQVAQPQILVMENGFHGRTLATLSATGNPAKQRGFEPLMPGFLRVPYNDLDAVRQAAAREIPKRLLTTHRLVNHLQLLRSLYQLAQESVIRAAEELTVNADIARLETLDQAGFIHTV